MISREEEPMRFLLDNSMHGDVVLLHEPPPLWQSKLKGLEWMISMAEQLLYLEMPWLAVRVGALGESRVY